MVWILAIIVLVKLVIWQNGIINCFNSVVKRPNGLFINFNVPENYHIRRKKYISNIFNYSNKLAIKNNKIRVLSNSQNETTKNEKENKNIKTKDKKEQILKDIQGVWKFYFPMSIMDTEYGDDKERDMNDDEKNEKENYEETIEDEDEDEINEKKKKDVLHQDENYDYSNLNILRGERMHPLPLFVYDYEEIVSASNYTHAYWSTEYFANNIYECTIKLINNMNSKYMVILQGYLFISKHNVLNSNNIRLAPGQIFGNLFLATNDNAENNSLIPPNMKLYDKNNVEVKDVMSIFEKKIPEFRKNKKKIESFLGVRKWKYIGISTAYRTVGEKTNVFNIKHLLTGKDENVIYNIMDFDRLNSEYNSNNFSNLNGIFNSYFEEPSRAVLSQIIKNLQDKSINGPF
ncbi:conserved Plasmodium protein, unknown function [Plasmodium chabaudi chabaudi]|uniref:Uncharacterized protein n=1 Tax=Plasmodium chabaudi chabaudi TaxID=31271 RepID=A0A1C6X208_PLACU|nr:conserved Plasmodium protein, unknown function [Plasmodium chabaudi chabaudi]